MSHEPLMSWKSIPFIERPVSTLFVLSVLILMGVVLWQITVINWNAPVMYFLCMLILIANLMPYFIITQYDFYEDRLQVTYMMLMKIQRKYADFGCFYKDKYGVMLSTFKMPRRLDPFRGQSVRFSKDKQEEAELIELLKTKIGKQY